MSHSNWRSDPRGRGEGNASWERAWLRIRAGTPACCRSFPPGTSGRQWHFQLAGTGPTSPLPWKRGGRKRDATSQGSRSPLNRAVPVPTYTTPAPRAARHIHPASTHSPPRFPALSSCHTASICTILGNSSAQVLQITLGFQPHSSSLQSPSPSPQPTAAFPAQHQSQWQPCQPSPSPQPDPATLELESHMLGFLGALRLTSVSARPASIPGSRRLPGQQLLPSRVWCSSCRCGAQGNARPSSQPQNLALHITD